MKILLVDDDLMNITALKIILKYKIKLSDSVLIDCASDGLEAVNAVKEDTRQNN